MRSHKEGGEVEMQAKNGEEAGEERGPSKTSDKKNYDDDDEYPDI